MMSRVIVMTMIIGGNGTETYVVLDVRSEWVGGYRKTKLSCDVVAK